jgi:hypothetical protein
MILKSDFVKVIFASAGASDIRYKGAGGKKKQGFVARSTLADAEQLSEDRGRV